MSEKRAGIERHVQTIMVGLITAGILWMATSVWSTGTVVARMDERVNGIAAQMRQLSDAVRSASDTAMPRSEARQRFGDVERRLDNIEKSDAEQARELARLAGGRAR